MSVPLHGWVAQGLLLLRQEVGDADHSDHAESEGTNLKTFSDKQGKHQIKQQQKREHKRNIKIALFITHKTKKDIQVKFIFFYNVGNKTT